VLLSGLDRRATAGDNVVTYVVTKAEGVMVSVGVRELKARASEILRDLRRRGGEVEITFRGRPVARIVPVRRRERAGGEGRWRALDVIAAEIGRRFEDGASAARAIEEGRR
jgi:prevent-host-death family protein